MRTKSLQAVVFAASFCFLFSGSLQGELPGQIVADPSNPAWLVYNRDDDGDGKLDPFFMCGPGDPEGFLYLGTRQPDGTRSGGGQTNIISQIAGTGANCMYLMAIRSHGGDGDATQNPFVGSDPSGPLDEDILDQWEGWLTQMDDAGIVTYLFFYDDNIRVGDSGPNRLGWALDPSGDLHPEERGFVEGIVNRFEHHRNLIWSVMEEVQEMGGDHLAHAAKIAEAIRQADDNRHPIACHQLTGTTFLFPDEANLDQFAMQISASSPASLHAQVLAAWNSANGRYGLNMAETAYHKALIQNGSRTELRQANWATAMGGAYIMMIGTWTSGTPSAEMLADCGRVVSFFESTNFNEMAPHDELGHAGTEYVLASPGDSYILYASNLAGGSPGVRNLAEGLYDLVWFSPVDGTTVWQSNLFLAGGDQILAAPAGIGSEVAVWVRLVPEPATMSLVALGACLPFLRRRRRVRRGGRSPRL